MLYSRETVPAEAPGSPGSQRARKWNIKVVKCRHQRGVEDEKDFGLLFHVVLLIYLAIQVGS